MEPDQPHPAVLKPADWTRNLPRAVYRGLKLLTPPESWFQVYDLGHGTFALYEDGQYEESISYLLLGAEKALLIDTGNGIGNLRQQVRALTSLPVQLVLTHSHIDHVGSCYQFDQVAAFDDADGLARRTAMLGYPHEKARTYIAEPLVRKPFPRGFDPAAYCIPPYRVTRWLADGEVLDLGGRSVEVVHAPGHSPDSICLLDRGARMLWVGDVFYTGQIYTWLAGGDVGQLVASYRRLVELFPAYDLLMPAHNEPAVEKAVLREALAGAEKVLAGAGGYTLLEGGRRKYDFGRFAFVTGPA
ncbi:MAG: MBL fold metallo-hydrolase [Holophaga sp.]|jgi:glyoxylase-like metal-dependent hydrolase (beta-lactamase superfamily II)